MANSNKRQPRWWRVSYADQILYINAVGWYSFFGKTIFYTRDGLTTRTVAEFSSVFVMSIIDNAECSVDVTGKSVQR